MNRVVHSAALNGLTSYPVVLHFEPGRGFEIKGNIGEASAKEIKIRVRSALQHMGHAAPDGVHVRVECELDLSRGGHGSALDLAVALGLMDDVDVQQTLVIGELALDGHIRGVRGTLVHLRSTKLPYAIVPAAYRNDTKYAMRTTAKVEAMATLGGERFSLTPHGPPWTLVTALPGTAAMRWAKERMEQFPEPTNIEWEEIREVLDAGGLLHHTGLNTRPFRAPHHTASEAAIVGGGSPIRPGEVTLAHHGVLMLDELPEYRVATLEALARTLQRGAGAAGMPARPFWVCAIMSPCPCGRHTHKQLQCKCTDAQRAHWQKRIPTALRDLFPETVTLA